MLNISVESKQRLKNILERAKKLAQSKTITVGIHEAEGSKEHPNSDVTVATIGAFQEYGWIQHVTNAQANWLYNVTGWYGALANGKGNPQKDYILTLPPRPWLRGTFIAENEKWREFFIKALQSTKSAQKALTFLGDKAVEDIRETIRTNGTSKEKFPKRSPLTKAIYATERFGHSQDGTGNIDSDEALVVDGTLLQSIKWNFEK